MTKTEYRTRRKNGLCVRCGGKVISGKSMCADCAEKERKRVAENRKALRDMSFCPRCGKNKLFGDEKMCVECSAKMYEYNQSHKGNTSKNYIAIRKEKGVCIKCGKRTPEQGKTRCKICNYLENQRAKRTRNTTIPRSERGDYGLCYRCGKPAMEHKRLCESCFKDSLKCLQLAYVSGKRFNITKMRIEDNVFFGGKKE